MQPIDWNAFCCQVMAASGLTISSPERDGPTGLTSITVVTHTQPSRPPFY